MTFSRKIVRCINKTLVRRKFFSTFCPSTRKRDPSRYVQEIIRGNPAQTVQIDAFRHFCFVFRCIKKVWRITGSAERILNYREFLEFINPGTGPTWVPGIKNTSLGRSRPPFLSSAIVLTFTASQHCTNLQNPLSAAL
jgi:hypothetical protein